MRLQLAHIATAATEGLSRFSRRNAHRHDNPLPNGHGQATQLPQRGAVLPALVSAQGERSAWHEVCGPTGQSFLRRTVGPLGHRRQRSLHQIPTALPRASRTPGLRPTARLALFALFTALCLAGPLPTVRAEITWTGNVDPADPTNWTRDTYGYVGKTSNGTLTVDSTSVLYSWYGYIANSGVTGNVTVDGTGSTWSNRGSISVGWKGGGTLNVTSGGQVSDVYGYIGYFSSGTGTATVSGTGSTWNNSYDLYVGRAGKGTLEITAGGAVNNRYGYIGNDSNSTGKATVSGTGSAWTNSSNLYIGPAGKGTLEITAGGAVSNSMGSIGSTGTTTVDGAGSTWTNGSLRVDGTLHISGGGAVDNSSGYIGYSSGSTGAATVTGAGSRWTNNSDLRVGYSGSGTLNITGGGAVTVADTTYLATTAGSIGTINFSNGTLTTGSLRASPTQLTGTGMINTRGLVSDIDLVFDSIASLNQTLTFNTEPGQNVTLDLDMASNPSSNGALGAGWRGNGSVTIRNGIAVNSQYGYIGYNSGSTGVATVTGAGSTWTNGGNLSIGGSGSGTLSITNGGTVVNGNGSISSMGVATVTGAGSRWTNSGNLSVGGSGSGTLNITGGGVVSNGGNGTIGFYSGSTGVVTVDGDGSTWTNNSDLRIGYSGGGTLNINGGGAVTVAGTTYLASTAGSSGTINFTNGTLTTRSLWTSPTQLAGTGTINTRGLASDLDLLFDSLHGSPHAFTLDSQSGQDITVNLDMSDPSNVGDLVVGYQGNGSLTIREGIAVNSQAGYIGYSSGSTGEVTVAGGGSTWTNSGYLYIGERGIGTLNIAGGGAVNNSHGSIGHYSNSMGTVTVNGTGSTWTNSMDLNIGGFGSGTLNITGGGAVTATSVSIMGQLLAIDVGQGSILAVDNGNGTITNYGMVRITAGANATAGAAYMPISAGTWIDDGIYKALGGTWNGTNHVFTVSDVQHGSSGKPVEINLVSKQRILVDDPKTDDSGTGWSVGASFLAAASETPISFTATAIDDETSNALKLLLEPGQSVLGGWEFSADGYGSSDPAYLSFAVGPDYGRDDLQLWHYDGIDWTEYAAADLTCDGTYASFTVTGFSGYAVTAAMVPEPGTLVMLLAAAAGLLAYTRWKRMRDER